MSMNLILEGLDIFDEFEGNEIETKIELYPKKPDLFTCLLKKNIEESKGFLFKLIPKKEEILNWTYYFDRYSYKRWSKFVEAYTLIYNPNKEKFWIKIKELPENIKSKNEILIRKENLVRIERKMTKMDSDLILQRKIKELGKEIFFLGTIKRYKVYLLLQNHKSGRYYSVSADRCQYKKFTLSQIEIEYKGITKIRKIKLETAELKKIVTQEIFILSKFLMKKMGNQFKLKKTKQTKFEWLCSCLDQEKSR